MRRCARVTVLQPQYTRTKHGNWRTHVRGCDRLDVRGGDGVSGRSHVAARHGAGCLDDPDRLGRFALRTGALHLGNASTQAPFARTGGPRSASGAATKCTTACSQRCRRWCAGARRSCRAVRSARAALPSIRPASIERLTSKHRRQSTHTPISLLANRKHLQRQAVRHRDNSATCLRADRRTMYARCGHLAAPCFGRDPACLRGFQPHLKENPHERCRPAVRHAARQ